MATRSWLPSVSASIFIAFFTSGSLSLLAIDPDTSSRNTRLRGGVFPAGNRRAWRPISASLWRLSHGHGASSVVMPKGAACVESA